MVLPINIIVHVIIFSKFKEGRLLIEAKVSHNLTVEFFLTIVGWPSGQLRTLGTIKCSERVGSNHVVTNLRFNILRILLSTKCSRVMRLFSEFAFFCLNVWECLSFSVGLCMEDHWLHIIEQELTLIIYSFAWTWTVITPVVVSRDFTLSLTVSDIWILASCHLFFTFLFFFFFSDVSIWGSSRGIWSDHIFCE